MSRDIILASASPRRRELFLRLFNDFKVIPSSIIETREAGYTPEEATVRNAHAKARDIAKSNPRSLVVGADTLVAIEDEVMGKPADAEDAKRMLTRLSGKEHRVITGIAMVLSSHEVDLTGYAVTKVKFRELAEIDIEDYVSRGSCMDKAGAYGIQEVGDAFVEKIDGNYDNVVGMPLELVSQMLSEIDKMLKPDKKV